MVLVSNDGSLSEVEVLSAGDRDVEDEIDDEEAGGPVHAGRVDLSGSAVGTEARDE